MTREELARARRRARAPARRFRPAIGAALVRVSRQVPLRDRPGAARADRRGAGGARAAANEPAPDRLAGPELGAVPLAAATALATGIPFLIVRKAAKDYATEGLIEGVFEAGERVLVIEDVVTTGGALIAAVEALRAAGLVVRACALRARSRGGRRRGARGARRAARSALPPSGSGNRARLRAPAALERFWTGGSRPPDLRAPRIRCKRPSPAVRNRLRVVQRERPGRCVSLPDGRETAWICGFVSGGSASVLAVPNRGGNPRDQG